MFVSRFFQFAAVAAGLGVVSAQISLSGLSSSCQSTLTSIVISPASSCLNAQGLVAIATTSANASLIGPLNSWLSGMCGQPACSNTTLTDIVSNVTSGCASDLSNLGATGFTPQSISDVLVAAYPALREAACLTDTSNNNTICLTETFTNIQNATGSPFTFNEFVTFFGTLLNGALPSNVPSSAVCTDCTKEIFNIVEGQIPGISSGSVNITGNVSNICGADFINGSTPSTISQSASNSTQSVSADNTTSFAVVQSPFGLLGIFISSILAFGSGLALVM